MDVREKLEVIAHLGDHITYKEDVGICYDSALAKVIEDAYVELKNGVTVQECGHWVCYQSDEPYGCNDEKEWHKCSKCGKDAYGRCYDDEWYSAPILSSHCPHCGAKMIPKPPKGE